jgi:DNA-binding MarR family transcriptional regulator
MVKQESIDKLIEETYNDFLSLRMDSTPYKVLLHLFWSGRISSPKKISDALKLDLSVVKMAVRQLYKMGLIRNPRRGLYGPNRDKCLALFLHIHRLLKE